MVVTGVGCGREDGRARAAELVLMELLGCNNVRRRWLGEAEMKSRTMTIGDCRARYHRGKRQRKIRC